MEWLSADAFAERYAHEKARYVLHPNNSPYYYDTVRTGGVGGKANTRIGAQNAYFKGAQIHAGRRTINPGNEIFVSYGNEYHFGDDVDDERQGWIFARRGRPTGSRSPAPFTHNRPTPAPLRGGEGGHLSDGRVFQHALGVSAPT